MNNSANSVSEAVKTLIFEQMIAGTASVADAAKNLSGANDLQKNTEISAILAKGSAILAYSETIASNVEILNKYASKVDAGTGVISGVKILGATAGGLSGIADILGLYSRLTELGKDGYPVLKPKDIEISEVIGAFSGLASISASVIMLSGGAVPISLAVIAVTLTMASLGDYGTIEDYSPVIKSFSDQLGKLAVQSGAPEKFIEQFQSAVKALTGDKDFKITPTFDANGMPVGLDVKSPTSVTVREDGSEESVFLNGDKITTKRSGAEEFWDYKSSTGQALTFADSATGTELTTSSAMGLLDFMFSMDDEAVVEAKVSNRGDGDSLLCRDLGGGVEYVQTIKNTADGKSQVITVDNIRDGKLVSNLECNYSNETDSGMSVLRDADRSWLSSGVMVGAITQQKIDQLNAASTDVASASNASLGVTPEMLHDLGFDISKDALSSAIAASKAQVHINNSYSWSSSYEAFLKNQIHGVGDDLHLGISRSVLGDGDEVDFLAQNGELYQLDELGEIDLSAFHLDFEALNKELVADLTSAPKGLLLTDPAYQQELAESFKKLNELSPTIAATVDPFKNVNISLVDLDRALSSIKFGLPSTPLPNLNSGIFQGVDSPSFDAGYYIGGTGALPTTGAGFGSNFNFNFSVDPIILNLIGGAVHTTNAVDSGVRFSSPGTSGRKVRSGWIYPDHGFLVVDKNNNNLIDDMSEMFSEYFLGSKSTGYEALRTYDSNGDGAVSAADKKFGEIRVWVDKNVNAKSESSELYSLFQLGITSLGLNSAAVGLYDNGNLITANSSFVRKDGSFGEMAEALFVGDVTDVSRVYVTDNVVATRTSDGRATQVMIGTSNQTVNAASSGVNVLIGGQGDVLFAGNSAQSTLIGTGGAKLIGNSATSNIIVSGDNNIVYAGSGTNNINFLSGVGNVVNAEHGFNRVVVGDAGVEVRNATGDQISFNQASALTVNGTNNLLNGKLQGPSETGGAVAEDRINLVLKGNGNQVRSAQGIALEVSGGQGNSVQAYGSILHLTNAADVNLNGSLQGLYVADGSALSGDASVGNAIVTGASNKVELSSVESLTMGSGAELRLTADRGQVNMNGFNQLSVAASAHSPIPTSMLVNVDGGGNVIVGSQLSVILAEKSAVAITGSSNDISLGGENSLTLVGRNNDINVVGRDSSVSASAADISVASGASLYLVGRGNDIDMAVGGSLVVDENSIGNQVSIDGGGSDQVDTTVTMNQGYLISRNAGVVVLNGELNNVQMQGGVVLQGAILESNVSVAGQENSIYGSNIGGIQVSKGGELDLIGDGNVVINSGKLHADGNGLHVTSNGTVGAEAFVYGDQNVIVALGGQDLFVFENPNYGKTTVGGQNASIEANSAGVILDGDFSGHVKASGVSTISMQGDQVLTVEKILPEKDKVSIFVQGDNNVVSGNGLSLKVKRDSEVSFTGDDSKVTAADRASVNLVGDNMKVTAGDDVKIYTKGDNTRIDADTRVAIIHEGDALDLRMGSSGEVQISGESAVLRTTNSSVELMSGSSAQLVAGNGNDFVLNGDNDLSVKSSGNSVEIHGDGNILVAKSSLIDLAVGAEASIQGGKNSIMLHGLSDLRLVGDGNSVVSDGGDDSLSISGKSVDLNVSNGNIELIQGVKSANIIGSGNDVGAGSNIKLTVSGGSNDIKVGDSATLTIEGDSSVVDAGQKLKAILVGDSNSLDAGVSAKITSVGDDALIRAGSGGSVDVSGQDIGVQLDGGKLKVGGDSDVTLVGDKVTVTLSSYDELRLIGDGNTVKASGTVGVSVDVFGQQDTVKGVPSASVHQMAESEAQALVAAMGIFDVPSDAGSILVQPGIPGQRSVLVPVL
jgi:hypothetical protein